MLHLSKLHRKIFWNSLVIHPEFAKLTEIYLKKWRQLTQQILKLIWSRFSTKMNSKSLVYSLLKIVKHHQEWFLGNKQTINWNFSSSYSPPGKNVTQFLLIKIKIILILMVYLRDTLFRRRKKRRRVSNVLNATWILDMI